MRARLFWTYCTNRNCTSSTSSGTSVPIVSYSLQLVTFAHSFAASVILRVVYGKTTPTLLNDPYLLQLQKMIPRIQSAMVPGAYLVDKYPILKYVPGYGRNLKEWSRQEYNMLFSQLNEVKSQMVRTLLPWCSRCIDLIMNNRAATSPLIQLQRISFYTWRRTSCLRRR